MSRIKKLRKAKGLTMKELGDVLGVAESTISLYENDKRQPDRDTIKKIADLFNVSIDYLYCRTDVPYIASAESIETKKEPEQNAGVDENIIRLFSSLGTQDQERIIAFAEALAASRKV